MYRPRGFDRRECPEPPHLLLQQNRFQILNAQNQQNCTTPLLYKQTGNTNMDLGQGHSTNINIMQNQGQGCSASAQIIRCRRMLCQTQEFYYMFPSPRRSSISNHPSGFRTMAQRRLMHQRLDSSSTGNSNQHVMIDNEENYENYMQNNMLPRNTINNRQANSFKDNNVVCGKQQLVQEFECNDRLNNQGMNESIGQELQARQTMSQSRVALSDFINNNSIENDQSFNGLDDHSYSRKNADNFSYEDENHVNAAYYTNCQRDCSAERLKVLQTNHSYPCEDQRFQNSNVCPYQRNPYVNTLRIARNSNSNHIVNTDRSEKQSSWNHDVESKLVNQHLKAKIEQHSSLNREVKSKLVKESTLLQLALKDIIDREKESEKVQIESAKNKKNFRIEGSAITEVQESDKKLQTINKSKQFGSVTDKTESNIKCHTSSAGKTVQCMNANKRNIPEKEPLEKKNFPSSSNVPTVERKILVENAKLVTRKAIEIENIKKATVQQQVNVKSSSECSSEVKVRTQTEQSAEASYNLALEQWQKQNLCKTKTSDSQKTNTDDPYLQAHQQLKTLNSGRSINIHSSNSKNCDPRLEAQKQNLCKSKTSDSQLTNTGDPFLQAHQQLKSQNFGRSINIHASNTKNRDPRLEARKQNSTISNDSLNANSFDQNTEICTANDHSYSQSTPLLRDRKNVDCNLSLDKLQSINPECPTKNPCAENKRSSENSRLDRKEVSSKDTGFIQALVDVVKVMFDLRRNKHFEEKIIPEAGNQIDKASKDDNKLAGQKLNKTISANQDDYKLVRQSGNQPNKVSKIEHKHVRKTENQQIKPNKSESKQVDETRNHAKSIDTNKENSQNGREDKDINCQGSSNFSKSKTSPVLSKTVKNTKVTNEKLASLETTKSNDKPLSCNSIANDRNIFTCVFETGSMKKRTRCVDSDFIENDNLMDKNKYLDEHRKKSDLLEKSYSSQTPGKLNEESKSLHTDKITERSDSFHTQERLNDKYPSVTSINVEKQIQRLEEFKACSKDMLAQQKSQLIVDQCDKLDNETSFSDKGCHKQGKTITNSGEYCLLSSTENSEDEYLPEKKAGESVKEKHEDGQKKFEAQCLISQGDTSQNNSASSNKDTSCYRKGSNNISDRTGLEGKITCKTPSPKKKSTKVQSTGKDFSFLELGYCPLALPLGCYAYEDDADKDENNNNSPKRLENEPDIVATNKHMRKLCDEKYNHDNTEILRPWVIRYLDEISKPTIREEFLDKMDLELNENKANHHDILQASIASPENDYSEEDDIETDHRESPLIIPLDSHYAKDIMKPHQIKSTLAISLDDTLSDLNSIPVSDEECDWSLGEFEKSEDDSSKDNYSDRVPGSYSDAVPGESDQNEDNTDSAVGKSTYSKKSLQSESNPESSGNIQDVNITDHNLIDRSSTEVTKYTKNENREHLLQRETPLMKDNSVDNQATNSKTDSSVSCKIQSNENVLQQKEANFHQETDNKKEKYQRKDMISNIETKSDNLEKVEGMGDNLISTQGTTKLSSLLKNKVIDSASSSALSTKKTRINKRFSPTENQLFQEAMNFLCSGKIKDNNEKIIDCFSNSSIRTRQKSSNMGKDVEQGEARKKKQEKPSSVEKDIVHATNVKKKRYCKPSKVKELKEKQKIILDNLKSQKEIISLEKEQEENDENCDSIDETKDHFEPKTKNTELDKKVNNGSKDRKILVEDIEKQEEEKFDYSFVEMPVSEQSKCSLKRPEISMEVLSSKQKELSSGVYKQKDLPLKRPDISPEESEALTGLLTLGEGHKSVETQTLYNTDLAVSSENGTILNSSCEFKSDNTNHSSGEIIQTSELENKIDQRISNLLEDVRDKMLNDDKSGKNGQVKGKNKQRENVQYDKKGKQEPNLEGDENDKQEPNLEDDKKEKQEPNLENDQKEKQEPNLEDDKKEKQEPNFEGDKKNKQEPSLADVKKDKQERYLEGDKQGKQEQNLEGDQKDKCEQIHERHEKDKHEENLKSNKQEQNLQSSKKEEHINHPMPILIAAATENDRSVPIDTTVQQSESTGGQTVTASNDTPSPLSYEYLEHSDSDTIPLVEKPVVEEKTPGKWLIPILERLNIDISKGRLIVTKTAQKLCIKTGTLIKSTCSYSSQASSVQDKDRNINNCEIDMSADGDKSGHHGNDRQNYDDELDIENVNSSITRRREVRTSKGKAQ
ncbi:reticulocyte-binding protein homolog 2a-like [Mytilus californianus]|uniref:reticulocyte-binding protein homolog 2a-like n=1 Tax=Mytilus californianus TaxID=6549 RepID=UPI0022459B99|nr:reticulocyte-binding protein homolog 2a-like [Mytilus californianus]